VHLWPVAKRKRGFPGFVASGLADAMRALLMRCGPFFCGAGNRQQATGHRATGQEGKRGSKCSKTKNKVPCLVKKWEGKRVHSLNLVISLRRSVQS